MTSQLSREITTVYQTLLCVGVPRDGPSVIHTRYQNSKAFRLADIVGVITLVSTNYRQVTVFYVKTGKSTGTLSSNKLQRLDVTQKGPPGHIMWQIRASYITASEGVRTQSAF